MSDTAIQETRPKPTETTVPKGLRNLIEQSANIPAGKLLPVTKDTLDLVPETRLTSPPAIYPLGKQAIIAPRYVSDGLTNFVLVTELHFCCTTILSSRGGADGSGFGDPVARREVEAWGFEIETIAGKPVLRDGEPVIKGEILKTHSVQAYKAPRPGNANEFQIRFLAGLGEAMVGVPRRTRQVTSSDNRTFPRTEEVQDAPGWRDVRQEIQKVATHYKFMESEELNTFFDWESLPKLPGRSAVAATATRRLQVPNLDQPPFSDIERA